MGWYVGTLLLNKIVIKSRIETALGKSDDFNCNPLDDFDYNNLLILESKVEVFFKRNIFTRIEKVVLVSIFNGKDFNKTASDFNLDDQTVKNSFVSVCDKISFLLGDEFSDEGYIEYLKTKHRLTDEQVNKARYIIDKEWNEWRKL